MSTVELTIAICVAVAFITTIIALLASLKRKESDSDTYAKWGRRNKTSRPLDIE